MPQHWPSRHLRQVAEEKPRGPAAAEGAHVLQYTNRRGVPWFLHQGTTKTGKPRYCVAKSIGPGALAEMPAGFEFSEGVNGVVSVRRVDKVPELVADSDAELVRSEVARHRHLRFHRVEVGKAEIVISEPIGPLSDAGIQSTSEIFGLPPSFVESRISALQAKARYAPVMKFVAGALGGSNEYDVHRMRYRGEGGWSYPLAHGPLSNLVRDFVRHVSTQKFFDLW